MAATNPRSRFRLRVSTRRTVTIDQGHTVFLGDTLVVFTEKSQKTCIRLGALMH